MDSCEPRGSFNPMFPEVLNNLIPDVTQDEWTFQPHWYDSDLPTHSDVLAPFSDVTQQK